MINYNRLHTCDRCQSVFGVQQTAHYRVKGILIKWSYYCAEHALDHASDYPDHAIEYSENGFAKEENNQYWKEE